MTIMAMRKGRTAQKWTHNISVPKLAALDDQIAITLIMPSGGGGMTEVAVMIFADSFDDVANAMIGSNPKAARKAFGAALLAED